jgi:hypothetical protein
VALYLLHLHWKQDGGPINLANGGLIMKGVSRFAKQRALNLLERAGLISVQRRSRRSPVVQIMLAG